MKKLAFVAAAALAGSCFADGIASANIVGYMQNDLTNGYSIIVSPFAAINATQTIDIQDLVPVDAKGQKAGAGTFEIQLKKANGAAGKSFIYCVGDDTEVGEDAWFENNLETKAVKSFAIGESFLFYSNVKGAALTYNGEVISKALELPLISGYQFIGNPRATKINIQELIPVNASGSVVGAGTFEIQLKKADGSAGKSFIYCVGDDTEAGIDAWFENDLETKANIDFAPGEGFLFYSNITGGKLTLQKQNL